MTASASPHPPPSVYSVSIRSSAPLGDPCNGFLTSFQNNQSCTEAQLVTLKLLWHLPTIYFISFFIGRRQEGVPFYNIYHFISKELLACKSYLLRLWVCVYTADKAEAAWILMAEPAFITYRVLFSWGLERKLQTLYLLLHCFFLKHTSCTFITNNRHETKFLLIDCCSFPASSFLTVLLHSVDIIWFYLAKLLCVTPYRSA